MTPDTAALPEQQQYSTFLIGCGILLALSLLYIASTFSYQWRKDIKRHVDNLRARQKEGEGNLPLTPMIRIRPLVGSRGALPTGLGHEWNLRPGYVAANKGGIGKQDENSPSIGLTSLAEYCSTVQISSPPTSSPTSQSLLREDIDAIVTKALIQSLGPKIGSLLLPVLDVIPKMRKDILGLTSLSEAPSKGSVGVVSGLGVLSLLELGAIADVVGMAVSIALRKKKQEEQMMSTTEDDDNITASKNQDGKSNEKDQKEKETNNRTTTTANEKMKCGESSSTFPSTLIPNPFILQEHFPQAIQHMLDEQAKKSDDGEDFDPDDYPVNVPQPVNKTLLPDLYFGYGGALGTHTHREMLQNRLLAILLNRLGANDLEEEDAQEKKFAVHVDIKTKMTIVTRPYELVSALAEIGYNVSVTPKLNITSFGLGLCVKEDDEGKKWSNIPVAVVLKSGYEDEEGRMALVALPHGGLVLEVTRGDEEPKGSPIMKGRCTAQHFVAIDGFCGWSPHHNVQVPWKIDDAVDSFPPMIMNQKVMNQKEEIEQSIRFAGYSAVVMNGAASRLRLPRGGYGLIGTCNDSLALVEMAMWGRTNVYPLLSIGKYHTHLVREAKRCVSRFEEEKRDPFVINDMKSILKALLTLPNDVVATPKHSGDAVRRMLHCMPPSLPFAFMEETKEVLESLKNENEAFSKCSP